MAAGAARLLARSYARRYRGAYFFLTLVMAAGAAGTIVPLAAASRTASVAGRALDSTRFPDVSVDVGGASGEQVDPLRRDPRVTALGLLGFSAIRPAGTDLVPGIDVAGVLPLDRHIGVTIDRPRVLEGRIPDPDRAEEVMINPSLARRLKLSVGDSLGLEMYAQQQVSDIFAAAEPPRPAGISLTSVVVGIGESITDAVDPESSSFGVIIQSHAAFREHGIAAADMARAEQPIGLFRLLLRARLARGERDAPAFLEHVADVYGDGNLTTVFSEARSDIFGDAEGALQVESLALQLVALAAAVATTAIVGQGHSRQQFVAAAPLEAGARAIGVRARHRAVAAFVPSMASVVAGTALGTVVAVAMSGAFPRGLGGRLEPDPGWRIEPSALALGVGGLVVVLGALIAASAARVTREAQPAGAPARLRVPLARPDVAMGVRLATYGGRPPRRVPVRQAITGASAAVAGIVAAVVFGASLSSLLDTPRLYGTDADTVITLQGSEGAEIAAREAAHLQGDGRIAGVTAYGLFELGLPDEVRVTGAAVRKDKGDAGPVVLSGRLPQAADEIALDPKDHPGRDPAVGTTVEAAAEDRATFRVVGLLTGPGFDFVVTEAGARSVGVIDFDEHGFLLGLRPATRDAVRRDLAERFAELRPVEPEPSVANLDRVRSFPFALAGLLGALGAAAIVHLLTVATRRRARDLAVLKVLGFNRRMVRSTVRWQALTVAGIGVVAGLVVGVIAGRGAWALVTADLAVVYAPRIQWLALLAIAVGTLVVAIAAAAIPGRIAARTPAGATLRAE